MSELASLLGYLTGPEQARLTSSLQQLNENDQRKVASLFEAKPSERKTPDNFNAWLKQARPAFQWDLPHLLLIQRELENLIAGENDWLMIMMPVRHGKSEQVTIPFPAYALDRNPSQRIITGSYSADLAGKFSRKTRRLVREVGVRLNPERRSAYDWETVTEGGLRAAGRTGGVTGFGADGLLLDDMIKNRAEAESKPYREAIWDTIQDDFLTRLEPGAWACFVGTPWHHDDHMARLLKEYGDQAEGGLIRVIRLAAMAEEDDPLGREPGAALWPDRFPVSKLQRYKDHMAASSWNGLFQCRPTAKGGEDLKAAWIKRIQPRPDEWIMRVQSWDTGTKAKELNDPSVCTTWLVYRTAPFYELEAEWRDRVTYPGLKQAIKDEAGRFDRVDAILIEDKGNGTAALQELKGETNLNIVGVDPITDKRTRFQVQTNHYRLGHVAHPDPEVAPWVRETEEELTTIPAAPNDDRGDSVSQFLAWASGSAHGFTFEHIGRGLSSRQGADAYINQ